MTSTLPPPTRLGPRDVARLGAHGMRTKPMRAVLSALGIAIGIAAVVAVIGIPASSARALSDQLATLGTNLLRAEPGQTFSGATAKLPKTAVGMAKRIKPVQSASGIGKTGKTVRRNEHIAEDETSGLAVLAATPDLLDVLGGHVRDGDFVDSSKFQSVVLGSVAATRLGITGLGGQLWIDGQWFTVKGVLDPMPLAPEIERSVLVGWEAAIERLGFSGHPGTVYVRADDNAVEDVRNVLGATLNPQQPNEVKVARPSDALAAKQLTETAYSGLFLGLGGVALLVGGVGVANTMVISVLERRREIGLRRALGATRRQVRGQFLAESVLLSGLGGLAGVLIGVAVTAGYSVSQKWPAEIPLPAVLGGVAVSMLIGAIAGAYPAMRAARLSPTEALA